GLAAGVLALVAVFARQVFHGGDVGFGFLMACRGVGALIGPFLGHRLAGRDHERLIPTIATALAVFGVGYMALGATPTLWLAGLSILVAHLGGGAQWVLSSYGLQRLVPDRIRGRVFAFDFALITLSPAGPSLPPGGRRSGGRRPWLPGLPPERHARRLPDEVDVRYAAFAAQRLVDLEELLFGEPERASDQVRRERLHAAVVVAHVAVVEAT